MNHIFSLTFVISTALRIYFLTRCVILLDPRTTDTARHLQSFWRLLLTDLRFNLTVYIVYKTFVPQSSRNLTFCPIFRRSPIDEATTILRPYSDATSNLWYTRSPAYRLYMLFLELFTLLPFPWYWFARNLFCAPHSTTILVSLFLSMLL